MKARFLAIGVAVLLVGSSVPAWAVPITFAFSGTITRVRNDYGYLDSSVVVGGHFSGYYTFESTVVDNNPDPNVGDYPSPSAPYLVMSVDVGDYTVSAPFGGISLENGKDFYGAGTSSFSFLGFPAGMVISLRDLDGAMLSSDHLPLTPPPFASLPSYLREISLVGRQDGATRYGVGGTVEYLAVVPEPAVIVLLVLGGGVALTSQRRTR